MIPRLLPALFVLLAACGGEDGEPTGVRATLADMGPDPQVQQTEVAPAQYKPPAGSWWVRSETRGPGQWYEEYASRDRSALMRVHVFPVQQVRAPMAVIGRAIDTFLRGLGTEGFGQSGHKTLAIWGAPAAQASWSANVGTRTVAGGARLVRVSDEHWAFAIGYVVKDGDAALLEETRAFVRSLEPSTPVFYARRFFAPEDMKLVVARVADEEPVTLRDLLAVELVLEAGVGKRFPLSTRAAVRAALRQDVGAKDAGTRKAYRETGRAFTTARDLPHADRLRGMRALGSRALKGLLDRAGKGYGPARKYAAVWRRLRATAVGTKADGLTVGDVRCLHELSAFLASLAADREVRPDPKQSEGIRARLKQRWPTLPAADKDALRALGTTWAALRRDWDRAQRDARNRMRFAAFEALTAGASGASDARLYMGAMQAVQAEALDALVLRAAELTAKRRADLLATLTHKPSTGWELGW